MEVISLILINDYLVDVHDLIVIYVSVTDLQFTDRGNERETCKTEKSN